MLGAIWLLQRRVARGAKKERTHDTVRIVSKRSLGAKAQLVVAEIDGARYVLGVSDGGISVIDRIDAAAERTASVAPVTALPGVLTAAGGGTAPAQPADAHRDLDAPLPLRRTHPQSRAAARAVRSTSLSTFLQKDAAQVLRRALGA